MQVKNFVHAHCHSEYSLLDGLMRISDWVPRAAAMGYESLCLTDHGVMYGAVEFYETCKQHGIKPIIGMEAYIAPGSRLERAWGPGSYPYHLILLAANETGYRNLMQLCSIGYLEGFYRKPRIDKEVLRAHSEGVVALTACLKGEVNWKLAHDDTAGAYQSARDYLDIFGPERFFMEIQRHGLPDQDRIIPLQLKLAEELGVTPVATNDAHYLQPEAASHQDVMMCIAMNKKVTDSDRLKMSSDQMFFKDLPQMVQTFAGLEQLLINSQKISDLCDHHLDLGKFHFPEFPVPPGMDTRTYLAKLAKEGLGRRRPNCGVAYHDRLDYELGVIDRMGFNAYFLIVQDFVNFAKDAGIEVGPGRGSAAGSLVAFATGITDIDPIEYGLIFERFLNPERASMPDVDIDFAPERRHEVIQYVSEKYGHDRVCQIVTFNRMKARAAIRDAGRVLDIPLPEVDKLAKLVPWGPKITLDEALETVPELRQKQRENPEIAKLLDTAKGIEGLCRNAGIHPAGIVIAQGPVSQHVPLQRMNNGEVVAQYDMTNVEKIGLVKMDFLGLKTLTYIRDCLTLVEQRRGKKIDIATIPVDDKKTFELLGSGDTLGLFQLEGSGMRALLMDMEPDKLGDIIACIALYRPGPLNSGLHIKYVKRKHGEERFDYPHPLMEPILGETYGVLTYQEQIAQLFVDLAGMTLGSAVKVIKIISKKRSREEINEYREGFVQGAKKLHGIPEKVTNQLFDEIIEFAGYGFNKAHSAAYGVVAYRTAYLKANYPEEFYTAYLTSEMENHAKLALIVAEMKDRGIPLVRPDINLSGVGFTIEDDASPPGPRTSASGHSATRVRFGLAGIKGMGEKAAEGIIEERGARPFADLADFCSRIDCKVVNKGTLEALIGAGALDPLPGNRAQKLAALDACLEYAKNRQEDQAKGQGNLFGGGVATAAPPAAVSLPDLPELPEQELLVRERQLTGLFLTRHPVEEEWPRLKRLVKPIGDLSADDEGVKMKLAGLVSGLQRKRSKNLAPYAIFNLEDVTGTIEALVFPQAFERLKFHLADDQIVVCAGRLQVDEREAGPDVDESADRVVRLKFLCDDVLPAKEVLEGSMAQTYFAAAEATRRPSPNGHTGNGAYANGAYRNGTPPPEREYAALTPAEIREAFEGPKTIHLEIAADDRLP
ncbi:MAG TPA: DNA polymerase III subunit alpha, partial [bacterium]|nr:DNA polymerase III subunit alpha [bacterium]